MAGDRGRDHGGGSADRGVRLSGAIGLRLSKQGQIEFSRPERPHRESSLVQRIAAFLKQQPGVYWWKERGDDASIGKPDIMGCVRGRFFAIECKQRGKTPTMIQLAELEKIIRAGGQACWCDQYEDFLVWWRKLTT